VRLATQTACSIAFQLNEHVLHCRQRNEEQQRPVACSQPNDDERAQRNDHQPLNTAAQVSLQTNCSIALLAFN